MLGGCGGSRLVLSIGWCGCSTIRITLLNCVLRSLFPPPLHPPPGLTPIGRSRARSRFLFPGKVSGSLAFRRAFTHPTAALRTIGLRADCPKRAPVAPCCPAPRHPPVRPAASRRRKPPRLRVLTSPGTRPAPHGSVKKRERRENVAYTVFTFVRAALLQKQSYGTALPGTAASGGGLPLSVRPSTAGLSSSAFLLLNRLIKNAFLFHLRSGSQ